MPILGLPTHKIAAELLKFPKKYVIPFLCEAAPNLLISYFLAYLALLAVRSLFLAA
jgi:hypothetical protein